TWCAICKSALPEITAFEHERGIPVVAITDEDRGRLDPFFAARTEPFPPLVATDQNRQAFLAYAVSGMPTFVLIDGKGVVRSYATGYSPGVRGGGGRRGRGRGGGGRPAPPRRRGQPHRPAAGDHWPVRGDRLQGAQPLRRRGRQGHRHLQVRRPMPSPSVGYFAYFTEQPYGLVSASFTGCPAVTSSSASPT